MTQLLESAKHAGLIYCGCCRTLNPKERTHCDCCGASVHSRIDDSINRTWAYLLAALVFLIPANILPIMTIKAFGSGEPDTIMSGIVSLFDYGLYPIGLIIFLASIMVPLLKIMGLIILLLSVQGKLSMGTTERIRLFRIVDFFGKWSMLDVFVVSLLVSLVDLGEVATVYSGEGITAFCAMVILTMLASHSFDTRLIWDTK